MYNEHLCKALFLELPLWSFFTVQTISLRDFCVQTVRKNRNTWMRSLWRMTAWFIWRYLRGVLRSTHYDELCVDVVNARRKLYKNTRSCDERVRSRSYLAFRSSLLKLLLPSLFLGDASLDRCQGLPRERTEQTSFFLWYRVRIFGHCLGCAQLSHLPASAKRDQWCDYTLPLKKYLPTLFFLIKRRNF